ncbi:MAG: histone deacetylase family protein [Pseudomonadota bacterium]
MINLYHHSDCDRHNPGQTHPENAGRLQSIMAALHNSPAKQHVIFRLAPLGTKEQVLLIHSNAHLERVLANSPLQGTRALDADTVMSPGTIDAALRGVGAACRGVDDLIAGTANQVFCLTRPPGHHATPDTAMGFCIFNNIAIAAQYAITHHHLERVAIIDFDVHHGNGTQDAFSGKPGVLYLSTHQSPLYPGTGTKAENIASNICNIPLAAATDDAGYQKVFSEIAIPELAAFKPQLILVSAGFDAHQSDPLAGLALTENSYYWLAVQICKLAKECCDGKILSVLEGGYNHAVLGTSVAAYLEGCASALED